MTTTAAHSLSKGSVLILSLLLLLVTTMLGISVGKSVLIQERMAGHQVDRSVAFQAAEAALRTAERLVLEQSVTLEQYTGNDQELPGFYDFDINPAPALETAIASDSIWQTVNVSGPAKNPRYIVERMRTPAERESLAADEEPVWLDVFRITAQGFGSRETTNVVLQSFLLL